MTPEEVNAWITSLAPTHEERIKIIEDLLDHANDIEWDDKRLIARRDKDGKMLREMSEEDRDICQAALNDLKKGSV